MLYFLPPELVAQPDLPSSEFVVLGEDGQISPDGVIHPSDVVELKPKNQYYNKVKDAKALYRLHKNWEQLRTNPGNLWLKKMTDLYGPLFQQSTDFKSRNLVLTFIRYYSPGTYYKIHDVSLDGTIYLSQLKKNFHQLMCIRNKIRRKTIEYVPLSMLQRCVTHFNETIIKTGADGATKVRRGGRKKGSSEKADPAGAWEARGNSKADAAEKAGADKPTKPRGGSKKSAVEHAGAAGASKTEGVSHNSTVGKANAAGAGTTIAGCNDQSAKKADADGDGKARGDSHNFTVEKAGAAGTATARADSNKQSAKRAARKARGGSSISATEKAAIALLQLGLEKPQM